MKSIALILIVIAAVIPSCGNDHKFPVDASNNSPDAPPASCAASTAFLVDCNDPSQCMSCICKGLGHEMYCTQACTLPTDCPAPSTSCTGGFCRR